ncbi:MAG: division/cell wall cluster transcriptional repressor MraZ [Paracoccaceae bacterium]
MARRFRGESVHKVDGKGRVSIPAPFRRVLEEGDPDWKPGDNPTFVLIYGRKGRRCLEGYSMLSMERVDDMISEMPRFSRDREILERMLNTQSVYAHVDENGRIVLSAKLRERIGVKSEAVFAGMGEKFQIWEPGAYQEDMNSIDQLLSEVDEENDPFARLDRYRPEN